MIRVKTISNDEKGHLMTITLPSGYSSNVLFTEDDDKMDEAFPSVKDSFDRAVEYLERCEQGLDIDFNRVEDQVHENELFKS